MPTAWTQHVDGDQTTVSTSHQLDGTLEAATVQIDGFKVREYEPDEVTDEQIRDRGLDYADRNDVYQEFSGGRHATLRFDVMDGTAILDRIAPEDSDTVRPGHMRLLPAGRRIVENLPGVEDSVSPLEQIESEYSLGEDAVIDRLDT